MASRICTTEDASTYQARIAVLPHSLGEHAPRQACYALIARRLGIGRASVYRVVGIGIEEVLQFFVKRHGIY
jgi:hypothetical protein